MKKMGLLLALMFSSSAFANTYVYHDWDRALRGIALTNACLTESDVKTIKPMKVCTKYVTREVREGDSVWYETICVASAMQDLSFSRSFEKQVCTKYVTEGDGNMICKKWTTVSDVLPTTIKIATVTEHGEWSNWPGVTSYFTFPICSK